jgi:hypothetical protein
VKSHSERAHSKFSASGAERWVNCSGSVALSEGVPDKSSPWAEEGTRAHEVLEAMMKLELKLTTVEEVKAVMKGKPDVMIGHANRAARFILKLAATIPEAEVQVETREYLSFIHPEMFGTYDGAVIDHFGVLHVFDFKYGAGHAVSPVKNLQMIFYGLAVAHKHDWNFESVRLWIIQPRIRGYDGPVYWDLSISKLKEYATLFKKAVEQVERYPNKYVEGSWCHWCKAKAICPLKQQTKLDKAIEIFTSNPVTGKEGSNGKESREESSKEKSLKKGKQKEVEEIGDFF